MRLNDDVPESAEALCRAYGWNLTIDIGLEISNEKGDGYCGIYIYILTNGR